MRNRRLLFHAFVVLFLGFGFLGTAGMQVGSANSNAMDCTSCNLGCPDQDLMEWGCMMDCGGSTSPTTACQEYICENGDTHAWSCGQSN